MRDDPPMRRLLGFIGRLIGFATAIAAGAAVWRLLNPDPEPSEIMAPIALFPRQQAGQQSRQQSSQQASHQSTVEGADVGKAPASPAWIPAVNGACSIEYPVKAKHSSEVFHSPEGASYERMAADRCYRDAEAAEADGLRPAKR